MVNLLKSHIVRQYIIVIVANFTFICFGMETGWTSPAIVKLKDANQTILAQPISDDNIAWIVSIGMISGMIVLFITPYLMDRLGRKTCMILVCIPRLAKCFLLMFATEVWMILFAKCMNGISDIIGLCVLSAYSPEIASKEIRGALGTISQISYCLGITIMLSVGPYLSYLMLCVMITVLEFALFIPLLFLPETPYFSYSKGRTEESIKVLTLLRESKEAAHEEMKDYAAHSKVTINKMEIFKNWNVWKSLGKGTFLMSGAQFTAYNSISYYLQSIFISTGSSVSSEASSLIIGCIELVACTCTIFVTDRFGRKPTLSIAFILVAVGLIGMGTYFHIKEKNHEIVGPLNYLPLISIMIVIFSYNAGPGSVMMTYMAELFDGNARAAGVSIIVFIAACFSFVTIRFFTTIIAALGPSIAYYCFGACSIIVSLFVVFCLPETKGKAFSQIQKEMKSKNNKENEQQNVHI